MNDPIEWLAEVVQGTIEIGEEAVVVVHPQFGELRVFLANNLKISDLEHTIERLERDVAELEEQNQSLARQHQDKGEA